MKSPKSTQAIEKQAVADVTAVLLTPEQLAKKLAVPVTWIREKTRRRARKRDADPLPITPLGKYVRFRWEEVDAWLKRLSEQRKSGRP